MSLLETNIHAFSFFLIRLPDRYVTTVLSGVVDPAETNVISREAGGFFLPFNASLHRSTLVQDSLIIKNSFAVRGASVDQFFKFIALDEEFRVEMIKRIFLSNVYISSSALQNVRECPHICLS
jgi:hypothetical protein